MYWLAISLAILSVPSLFVDLQLSQCFQGFSQRGPGDLRKTIHLFEAFGHGIGVAMLIVAVAVLDRARAREAFRLLACSFGAGVVNLAIKILFARTRPQTYWSTEFPVAFADTFHGLERIVTRDWSKLFDSSMQSFPSGHSATAAGIAAGLAWLYPQGRYFFAFLAAMTMLQRMQSGAHFLSDTLAGAALGVCVAAICCDRRLLGGRFDRMAANEQSLPRQKP